MKMKRRCILLLTMLLLLTAVVLSGCGKTTTEEEPESNLWDCIPPVREPLIPNEDGMYTLYTYEHEASSVDIGVPDGYELDLSSSSQIYLNFKDTLNRDMPDVTIRYKLHADWDEERMDPLSIVIS